MLHVGGFAGMRAKAGAYDAFALCLGMLPGIWSFAASDPSAPFTQKPETADETSRCSAQAKP